MNPFAIAHKSQNIELLAKIADSFVRKYECGVKFDSQTGQIFITGEENCTNLVAEEVTEFLNTLSKKTALVPTSATLSIK
jgi:hypothetical protein